MRFKNNGPWLFRGLSTLGGAGRHRIADTRTNVNRTDAITWPIDTNSSRSESVSLVS